MASYDTLPIIANMNPGNFIDKHYDSDNREFVVRFRHSDIKLPAYCYTAHWCIYDAEEDVKVCRFEVNG